MVEPGKKPSRGRAAMSGARLNGRAKSPCTGSTLKPGKRVSMRVCASPSAAPLMSIGTYA